MAASMKILKYTGARAETEVSSLGFKRIDSAVPGSQDGAVDDRSDSIYYQIYTPQGTGITAASFEVWFRLAIDSPPDNQLCNVRLYVDGDAPVEGNAPGIFIGLSELYGTGDGTYRPTNAVSDYATTDIYKYTEDSPLLLTRGGNPTYIDEDPYNALTAYEMGDGEALGDYAYSVTLGDTGSGNVFYLDGEKQPSISLGTGNGTGEVTYTFNNTYIVDDAGGVTRFRLFTVDWDDLCSDTGIDGIVVYNRDTTSEYITIDIKTLMDNTAYDFSESILYAAAGADEASFNMGGEILLIDTRTTTVNEVIEYDVEVVDGVYVLNGIRKPVLTFAFQGTYIFNNKSGDTDPLRVHGTGTEGGSESNVIASGVSVLNGGTVDEVVTVDASEMFAFAGFTELVYQSTTNLDYGNRIDTYKTESIDGCSPVVIYDGVYHMNEIGDKTDFIVMQVQVKEDTSPGDYMPDIKIIWDES